MKNHEVAELLRNIAQLLEIKGELIFKIRAYEKAALVIENLDENIEDVWKKGKLDDIPGVGEALTKKISEFLETGKFCLLYTSPSPRDRQKSRMPSSA